MENRVESVSFTHNTEHVQDLEYTSDLVQLQTSSSKSSITELEEGLPDLPVATSTPNKLTKVMKSSFTSPFFKNDRFFAHSLEVSPTRPLTVEEQKLNTHFVRRQLNNSKTKVIKCKTSGQPIMLAKLIKPRKKTITC